MKRRTATTLLPSIAIFISGYAPLFLIMIIKDIESIVWFEHAFEEPFIGLISKLYFPYFAVVKSPEIVISLIVVAVLSLLMLGYVLRNIGSNPFDITITKAKSRSSEVVNYTIPYMISFVAFDLAKWQDLISLVIFLGILCLLSIRSQSIFINPILAALGYGLYDCTYDENGKSKECVMLSSGDLVSGQSAKYKKINNYMGFIS